MVRPVPVTLIAATAGDLEAVMAVMGAAFDPRFGEAWTRAQLASLFVIPGTRVGMAWHADRVAGFYAARRAGPESELMLLAVDPAVRRAGIGRRLLGDWRLWGQGCGVIDYFLEMRADNPARHLYERGGFVECGRRREYYVGLDGIKRDAITMRSSDDNSR